MKWWSECAVDMDMSSLFDVDLNFDTALKPKELKELKTGFFNVTA